MNPKTVIAISREVYYTCNLGRKIKLKIFSLNEPIRTIALLNSKAWREKKIARGVIILLLSSLENHSSVKAMVDELHKIAKYEKALNENHAKMIDEIKLNKMTINQLK